MLAAVFEALIRLAGIFEGLLSCLRDSRLIALGEKRARQEALMRQEEILARAKSVEAEASASHRRHRDDSGFDETFERKDEA